MHIWQDDPSVFSFYLLRVIGGNATDYKLDLLNDYLFGSKFNPNQSFIHWALWPTNKDLFYKTYTQFLENSEKEIVQIIASAPGPQIACQLLVDAANVHGGPDNITSVLISMPE